MVEVLIGTDVAKDDAADTGNVTDDAIESV